MQYPDLNCARVARSFLVRSLSESLIRWGRSSNTIFFFWSLTALLTASVWIAWSIYFLLSANIIGSTVLRCLVNSVSFIRLLGVSLVVMEWQTFPGLVSTSPAFVSNSASHPACPHGRHAQNNGKSGPHCWGRGGSTQFAQQLESAETNPSLVAVSFGASTPELILFTIPSIWCFNLHPYITFIISTLHPHFLVPFPFISNIVYIIVSSLFPSLCLFLRHI